jgi:hypothetical protein
MLPINNSTYEKFKVLPLEPKMISKPKKQGGVTPTPPPKLPPKTLPKTGPKKT